MPSFTMMLRKGLWVGVGLLVMACSYQSGTERSAAVQSLARQAGWQGRVMQTKAFDLQTFEKRSPVRAGVLTVYLEGDGYAWVDGRFPSEDPTPHQAMGLQLAMAQPGAGAVAYLGRPCQYIGAQTDARCDKTVWTDARFSPEAVSATSQALDQLKERSGAGQLHLVGYSGGAAIALLVASQRKDVSRIVTVAGNVDPIAWATQMKLQALTGSLDTRSVIPAISAIPQIYFVGGEDRVTPPAITENFVRIYPQGRRPALITLQNNGHTCCWAEQWANLWLQAENTLR